MSLHTSIAVPRCSDREMDVFLGTGPVTGDVSRVLLCRKMLEYASGAVTKNQAEKKINSLLDFMSTCQDNELLQRFYEVTLQSEEGQSNERLWFKTNLKLCDLWFQAEDFVPLSKALRNLNQVWALHTSTYSLLVDQRTIWFLGCVLLQCGGCGCVP